MLILTATLSPHTHQVVLFQIVHTIMSELGPVIHGLESQGRALTARALSARAGETERINFLCGTQSLRHENQLHLLDYSDETGVLDKTVYLHPQGEIW